MNRSKQVFPREYPQEHVSSTPDLVFLLPLLPLPESYLAFPQVPGASEDSWQTEISKQRRGETLGEWSEPAHVAHLDSDGSSCCNPSAISAIQPHPHSPPMGPTLWAPRDPALSLPWTTAGELTLLPARRGNIYFSQPDLLPKCQRELPVSVKKEILTLGWLRAPVFLPSLKAPVSWLPACLCTGFSRRTCLYSLPFPPVQGWAPCVSPATGWPQHRSRTWQMGAPPLGEAVGAQSELQWSGGHPVLPVEGAFLHPAGGWVVGPGL